MLKKRVAYQLKDEADYECAKSELIKAGLVPFLLEGYHDGWYFGSKFGSGAFTDGTLMNADEATIVESIEDFVSTYNLMSGLS